MLSSAAPSGGGRFAPKGWPVYSERPADLLRKPGFFTPRYPGFPNDQIQEKFKKIGNKFQNIELAKQVCEDEFKLQLFNGFDSCQIESIRLTFEKRHPITHNLGIIDRKYLGKVRGGELEGRDINVTSEEITKVIDLSTQILVKLHRQLFPTNK